MPRVNPLTAAQRLLQQDEQARKILLRAIGAYKAENEKSDEQLSNDLNWDRGKLSRLKASPFNAKFRDLKAVAQKVGLTSDDWLRIGGFLK